MGYLRARGKTVLFVTNRMEFVEASDSIVCMEQGRIMAQGSLEHVKAASPKLRHMLASVSNIDDHDNEGKTNDEEEFGPDDILPPLAEKAAGSGSKLVQAESREEGGISWSVVRAYYNAFGGAGTALFFVSVLFLAQVVVTANSFFLSQWGDVAGLVNESERENSTSPFRDWSMGDFIGGYVRVEQTVYRSSSTLWRSSWSSRTHDASVNPPCDWFLSLGMQGLGPSLSFQR